MSSLQRPIAPFIKSLIIAVCLGLGASQSLWAQSHSNGLNIASVGNASMKNLYRILFPVFSNATGASINLITQNVNGAGNMLPNSFPHLLISNQNADDLDGDDFHTLGERRPFLISQYVLVGPKSDPAEIKDCADPLTAFKNIQRGAHPFLSQRGEGANEVMEQRLWRNAEIDRSHLQGLWYHIAPLKGREALELARIKQAYMISDLAGWLSFENKSNLATFCQGHPFMISTFYLINLTSKNQTNTLAERFSDWLLSEPVQKRIGDYKIQGTRPFHPIKDESHFPLTKLR